MSRSKLLNELLNMNSPINDIYNELNKFSWDSEEELVSLTKKHIFKILKNYQQGIISAEEIEDWANAIENREDIGRENSYKDLIDEILYELANPYLTEKMTKERAKILLGKLV